MDTRDMIYYTEYKLDTFVREREHRKLVQLAKLHAARSARIFRIFPPRKRDSDATSG